MAGTSIYLDDTLHERKASIAATKRKARKTAKLIIGEIGNQIKIWQNNEDFRSFFSSVQRMIVRRLASGLCLAGRYWICVCLISYPGRMNIKISNDLDRSFPFRFLLLLLHFIEFIFRRIDPKTVFQHIHRDNQYSDNDHRDDCNIGKGL